MQLRHEEKFIMSHLLKISVVRLSLKLLSCYFECRSAFYYELYRNFYQYLEELLSLVRCRVQVLIQHDQPSVRFEYKVMTMKVWLSPLSEVIKIEL